MSTQVPPVPEPKDRIWIRLYREDDAASVGRHGSRHQLLHAVAAHNDIVDITTHEADLEEIFLAYYRDEEVSA